MTYPPYLRERAHELREQGLLIKQIAVEIGVPKPTVTRWLNSEFETRERANARRRKFSKQKICPVCGKNLVSNQATLCSRCYRRSQRQWTKKRIVQAIKDWAIEHGHPPTHQDWDRSGPGHPAIRSITDGPRPPFRSWAEALTAAGFVPGARRSKRGAKPLTEPQKRERAALRRKLREEKIRMAVKKGEQK